MNSMGGYTSWWRHLEDCVAKTLVLKSLLSSLLHSIRPTKTLYILLLQDHQSQAHWQWQCWQTPSLQSSGVSLISFATQKEGNENRTRVTNRHFYKRQSAYWRSWLPDGGVSWLTSWQPQNHWPIYPIGRYWRHPSVGSSQRCHSKGHRPEKRDDRWLMV